MKPVRCLLLGLAISVPLSALPGAHAAGDVVFADFEGSDWNGWVATGTAFGNAPIAQTSAPSYQGDFLMAGKKLVNSHAATGSDADTGTLTSPDFTISRRYVHFLIGGGNHPSLERVRLLDAADGSELRTATGHNSNAMRAHSWDVSDLSGRSVRIQIEDSHTGGWGNIGCDHIVFSDHVSQPARLAVERWTGVSGYDVSELTRSDAFFAAPEATYQYAGTSYTDIASFSGARLRGYITAPETGDYRFWVSASHGGELWLSTDASKYRKQMLANLGASVGTGHGIMSGAPNRWDRFSRQMSGPVHLVAGEKYFIEMLTQQGHFGGHHVSVAWAPPGGEREPLPMNVVSSYLQETADGDDDYLPDAWEVQHGLSASDNGGTDRLHEGEGGDKDMDGLSNRGEYLAGTDPADPDTDGDGIMDGDEVHAYGTDPAVSDAPSVSLAAAIDTASYTAADSVWTQTSEGLVSRVFRGSIEWSFTVASSGYYSAHIGTRLMGDLYLNESVPASLSIDGKTIWSGEIAYGQSREALVRAITHRLDAGAHTLRLDIDNMVARRSVAITSVDIFAPDGLDGDGNGNPDWVDTLLAGKNSIAPYSATSRTSPAFIEGVARVPSDVTVDSVPASIGVDAGHWYADIALDPSAATAFSVGFDPATTLGGSITWQETNIFDGESLVVRRDDSLKLSARQPSGATGEAVEITIAEDYLVYEDFENADWNGWTATGTAFGAAPTPRKGVPAYQGSLNAIATRVANSHAGATGSIAQRDADTGTLTSPAFTVGHDYIHFLIGGGNHPALERVRLLDAADGSELRTATGHNGNLMRWEMWDVTDLAGRSVRIQLEDNHTGAWGNIGVDQITFSNSTQVPNFENTSVFADFEGADWGEWTVTGTAFGSAPTPAKDVPSYQGNLNQMGAGLVNSHAATATDSAVGTLTSPDFTVTRAYIHFLIGGGYHPALERIRLLDATDDSELRTATGHNGNAMRWEKWDLSDLIGRSVKIRVEDSHTGGWGNIGIDQITFTDLASPPDFDAPVHVPATYQLATDADTLQHQFAHAGAFKLTATYPGGATASLNVNVRQATFSNVPRDLLSNTLGVLKFPASDVSADLYFDPGKASDLLSTSTFGGEVLLTLAPRAFGQHNLAARLHAGGPILATQPVNYIGISDALQNDLHSSFYSHQFQGYNVISSPLVATNLPQGGLVKVTIFRAGVTFLDGTKVKWISVSDISNGIINLEFLFPVAMEGGYCHYLDVYDRNGAYLGRR